MRSTWIKRLPLLRATEDGARLLTASFAFVGWVSVFPSIALACFALRHTGPDVLPVDREQSRNAAVVAFAATGVLFVASAGARLVSRRLREVHDRTLCLAASDAGAIRPAAIARLLDVDDEEAEEILVRVVSRGDSGLELDVDDLGLLARVVEEPSVADPYARTARRHARA